ELDDGRVAGAMSVCYASSDRSRESSSVDEELDRSAAGAHDDVSPAELERGARDREIGSRLVDGEAAHAAEALACAVRATVQAGLPRTRRRAAGIAGAASSGGSWRDRDRPL